MLHDDLCAFLVARQRDMVQYPDGQLRGFQLNGKSDAVDELVGDQGHHHHHEQQGEQQAARFARAKQQQARSDKQKQKRQRLYGVYVRVAGKNEQDHARHDESQAQSRRAASVLVASVSRLRQSMMPTKNGTNMAWA